MQSIQRTLGVLFVVMALVAAAPVSAEDAHAGFVSDYVDDFERAGGRLVDLAGATPADKFSWAPTEEVRTVSQVYVHVIFTNIFIPMALGAAPPADLEMPEEMSPMALMKEWEETMTDKDQVIAKLQESIEYAAKAVPTITDLETTVETFGFPGTKRAYLLILLTHVHEHLGQSIAYARSIGVVPPWSQQPGGDGEGG